MKKYHAEEGLVEVESGWSGSDMDVYLASEVDARIAELEHGNKVLRDELNRDENVMQADQARIAELGQQLEMRKEAINAQFRLMERVRELEKALAPFAAMDRPGCNLKELACSRGIASDMTIITSEDFRRAAEALGL